MIPTKEATPETQGSKEESQGEVNANDGVHLQITEIDVKQNDINTFERIFSNIGLKVTINRGLGEKASDDDKKTSTEEPDQTKTEKTEDKAEGNIEQESSDPILTGVTSEDVLGNADITAETSGEPELKADAVTDTREPEPHSTNSTGPVDVEIDSPIRKFFTAGIFVGLWKKKEDETTEQELEEVGGDKVIDTTGQTVQDRHEEEVTAAGVVGEAEEKENELRDETAGKSPEGEILSPQERDRSQMSPLLRFLSGSSLKRVSMKQRNIKSSEARLCDSGEHPSELLPSDPADDRGNAYSPTSEEAAKEEEGAWASFKRFMSPKPRMKKSHHSTEETQQPAKAEQMADHSSEEGKKRKNSSVSWEAVLCGSGRRRSRKTSDSEDEMPPIDLKYHKKDGGPKSGEESGAENEKETSSSSKQDGTLQEGDGGSTWKSLKRIVTPKRKSRDEDEGMKIKIHSDSEDAEEKSSFSIKNLLPGRKKQRSDESQGPVSSDEAGKGVASEDSETPAVVPLSEFEGDEEKKESWEEEENSELQQDQVEHTYLCFPQGFFEALEKQEDSDKELDEVSESTSKHQQLSDIQEEGVITEPGATLALVPKEVERRDDTTAEDLIEVASEAFTAPEPATDVTLQDETEMFTAASQFSTESAKTSGNATPVPAESNIIESDSVLHQVAETFSTSPQEAAPRPEQTFQAFVEKDPTVLALHRRPEAIPNETGLNVEDLEAISTLVCASLREGVSKVTEFQSVGFVSVEEFDSTEMTLDDVHVISVTQEIANEDEKNVPVSPVEQVKIKSVINGCQEPDLASTIGATTKNGDVEQEVPTLTDNGDLNKHSISDHPKVEAEEQPSAEEERVQDHAKELAEAVASGGGVDQGEHKVREASAEMLPLTEENVSLNAEHVQEPEGIEGLVEGHVPSLEPKVISHNISMCWGIETVGDKPEVETQILTQVILEQLDASKSIEEPEDLPAEQVSSSKLQEGNMSSHGPQMVSENLATAEADKGKADKTRLLTETLEPAETEVLQTLQETSSNGGEVNILLLETEVITENVSKAETVEDVPREEPRDILETAREPDVSQPYEASAEMSTEVNDSDNIIQLQELNNSTVLTEDTLEPVEASKTAENPDNILKEELDLDEIKKETINTEDTSGSPAEPEAMKAFALASEEDQVLPPETMILLKADLDTDEQKIHTTLITEDAVEPMDDAPNAEEAELSLESEESRGQSLEREVTSNSISEEKTVTDEPRSETTVVDETVIEPVDDSKTVQLLEELQPVQTSPLVGEESSISPCEPEETSENNLTAEGDTAENKGETMLHTDISNESEDVVKVLQEPEELQMSLEAVSQTLVKEKTAPDEPEDVKSITETLFEKVDYFKTVQTSTFVSEEFGIPSLDLEGPSENFIKADLVTEEHKMQTNLATKDTPEPLDDPQNVEEAELSVQPSCEETKNIHKAEEISENTPKAETVPDKTNEEMILDSEETKAVEELEALMTVHPTPAESEHPSMGKEATCDHVSGEERVLEEPKEVGILSDTNLQSENPSETVEEAKVLQALQQSLESEETKQETSDNVTEADRVPDGHRNETTVAGDTISEPEDESKTTEVVEELQTVQTSSLVSEEHSIPPLEAEEPPENIHGAESDADEYKVETVLVTEDTSASKTPEAPELFQTVQVCSLEIGDNSVSSAETATTSEIILKEETLPDEPRDETTIAGETIKEPVAGSKTDEVGEELQHVETSTFVPEDSSKSTLKAEDTFEDNSKEQLDAIENKVETVLIRVETFQPKTAEEPELSLQLTVQSSSLESEDDNIPSAEPERTSEIICKEETHPDESRIETIGEAICEPLDESKTAELEEQTVQPSSLVENKCNIPPLEAEEPFDSISKAERVPDETSEEITLDPEDTKTAEEPEALTAVRPTPEPEHPSLARETTCDNFSGEEKVPDEPKEEAIMDTCKPIQELELIREGVVPLLDTEELGGKSNNVVESEADTVLLSEVNPTAVDVHKPEVLSVEASNETQVTSEAETSPGEEDLRVETEDDEIKVVEPEEDLPVEEVKTVHTAEVHLDKSESEGETSEQKPETVPQDDQINQESSIPEEEGPAAAQVDKCQPKVVSGAVPDIHLMGQMSEALMDTMQAEKVAEEEDEAATPTVRDGVTKEVEGVGEVDADIEAEGTTVGSLLEVEAVGGKAAMEVCCSVVHTGRLSATTMPEKEQILAEDEVTAQGEKPQVESEECTNADAKERQTVDGQASTGELQVEVEGLTLGFEELCDVPSEQQEPKHLKTLGGPGCSESIQEDALDGHGNNKDRGKEKESAGAPVDRDELVDGEENMDIQKATAGSFYEVEEPLESERGDKDVEQTGLEREDEMTHASKVEEENEETNRAEEARRSEGDAEDADVVLEHPGNTSVTTVSLTGESPPPPHIKLHSGK